MLSESDGFSSRRPFSTFCWVYLIRDSCCSLFVTLSSLPDSLVKGMLSNGPSGEGMTVYTLAKALPVMYTLPLK